MSENNPIGLRRPGLHAVTILYAAKPHHRPSLLEVIVSIRGTRICLVGFLSIFFFSQQVSAGVICTGNCSLGPTLEAGSFDFGNGTLQVDGGSQLSTSGNAYVGSYNVTTNSSGTTTVSGLGTQVFAGGGAGSILFIGSAGGNGTLNVENQAGVTNRAAPSAAGFGDSIVAIGWGGTGTVNVSSGGVLGSVDFLGTGGNDGIIVGASSSAAVLPTGREGPGVGVLNVDGAGSLVKAVSRDANIAAYISVGVTNNSYTNTDPASGVIRVSGGGTVLVDGGTGTGTLAVGTGGVGRVEVSGPGSQIAVVGGLPGIALGNDFNDATEDGVGILSITNFGTVRVTPEPGSTAAVDVPNIPNSSYVAIGLGRGAGSAMVDTGGRLNVDGDLFVSLNDPSNGNSRQTGRLVVNNTGAVNVTGTTYIGNGTSADINGILAGTGTLNSDVVVQMGGLLQPGLSPGTIGINGDLAIHGGALEIQIAGLDAGQFDVLNVAGDVDLTNANVLFSFLDGFLPTAGDVVDFIIADAIKGLAFAHFAYEGAAPGFQFNVAGAAGGLQFLALNDAVRVPEPGTPLLLVSGFCLLVVLRKRSRTRANLRTPAFLKRVSELDAV